MSETSDIQVPNASLESVLAQLSEKEQQCKELEGARMTLQEQVQKLLHDNSASKSDLKKVKQWQLEKERLITDLDSANHALMQTEGRVHQLERDLNGARSAVESVQSKLKDTLRSNERESIQKEGLQADLEDARLAIVDLKNKCRLKDETSEKQRNALNEFSRKTEAQKKILEQHLDEARRREQEFEELQQERQIVTEKLGEKDKQLLSLRENYEKLRAVHRGKQSEGLQEREEIVKSLEASEAKSEEQELKLWKLENELRKMKTKAKQLETKSAAAETESNTKSILLKKVQTELDTLASSVAELTESKEQATVLKAKLTEIEKDLAEETTSRLKAECTLQHFKKREEHLLKVEEGHRELQGKAKWQNEQFQSLEEAYSKIRAQFEESQGLWETERTEMVREIDCLRDGLQSKSKRVQELCYQLDMLQQAFDHEQNHKKVLELDLAEAKTGMELAAADSERAHSAFENLRGETTTKLDLLRSNVASQERQIKDMELKEKDFMQEYEELKGLYTELQNLKCSQDELRQTLRARDNHIKALEEAKSKSIEMARGKEIEWEEEKDSVLKNLTDARVNLSSKDARLKELGVELEGAKYLINTLQKSITELGELHAEEKERVISTFEQANENVKEREEVVRKLKTELASIQVSLGAAISARVNSEHQSEVMEEQLFQTRGELKAVTEALNSLKESSKAESDSLLEALRGQKGKLQEMKTAHDAILGQKLVSFQEQEIHLVGFQKECQDLQQLVIHRDSEQKKIQEAHDQILTQLYAESKARHDEKEKLVMELLTYEGQGTEKEKHRLEVQSDLERHKDAILKLEARCESLEQQMIEQRLLVELASGQLAIERAESERLEKESQSLKETFAAAISAKDVSLEQLRKSFHDLEVEYSSSTGAVNMQTLQASSLENRLEEQQLLQANLEAKFCVTVNQLQKMSQQLGDVSTERDVLVKTLHEKETENADMRKESETLTAEISSLEGFAKSVEGKKLELSKELETSKAAIDKLCAALEVAEAESASGSRELKEIYNKLGYADTMSLQLQIAEEKAQEFEETLTETRATVEDKEERLAASEWAVQQLASEISKAKNSLAKKEREEAFLQERLSDLERHLRDKEREMAEMESYLEAVVQANDAKRADIEKLTLKLQDMKKGADEWKLREIDLETELNDLKNTLEDKIAALDESKSGVQRASEVHQVMEEAIQKLKRQLAFEGSERSARQGEMDALCCELQIAKQTASLANAQLHGLHGKLQQLEQGSEDRIKKTETISDEIHEELAATQFQLHNSETRLERAVSDLGHYKGKCVGFLETLDSKNKASDEMEVKLAAAEVELARQARMIEKITKERTIAHEQLHLQEEVQRGLEKSVALTESQMEEMEIYKQEMEQEVRKLKKALDFAKRDSLLKTQEAAGYKSHIEDLQEISGHYGDAQVMISRLTEELQMTSSTLEAREQRLLKLQASLKVTEEELRASRETVAAMECEREVLSVKLTVAESQVEDNQKQIAQIQQSLEVANHGLETQTANVLLHIAEMKKMEVELDEWKEKAATLAEEGSKVKDELELSLKDLETELQGWKGKHEEVTIEKQQLESDMQLRTFEFHEWKENAEVAAQEGRAMRERLETSFKELQNCCDEWKQVAETAEEKGRDVKLELENSLHALQAELTDMQDRAILESAAKSELERAVKTLQHDLGNWKEEAVRAAEMESLTRKDLEISMTDLRADLDEWKEKAGTAQDAERNLRGEFGSLVKELQTEVEVWKNTAASAAEAGNARKLELESSIQDLRLELDDWKNQTSARVDEERTVKMTLETTIVEFQAELEEWKKGAATAAEENRNMQAVFENSVKGIQIELQVWKEKAICAAEEGSFLKKEVQVLKTEVIGWKERAETSFERGNSEILNVNKSITETQPDMTEQKGATAVAEETKSLQLELQQSLRIIADLTAQMEAQKAKESLVENLTQQLESDLMVAREEAMTRKKKMLHILAQLENTHASQKELQAQLQMQHKRLLHEDELALTGYSFVEAEESFALAHENNVKRSLPELESASGMVKVHNRLEEEASILRAKALESQQEARHLATVLEAALTDLSGRNFAVTELKSELSGLRSFLRELELKGGLTEQASTLAVDRGEKDGGVENTKFRKGDRALQLCDSFVRDSGGQKCDSGAEAWESKRRGNAQTTPKSPPCKAKSPSTQLTNSSPRPDQSSPSSIRKRNVASPLSKPHRVSGDASICKILGEIDENSPTANSAERFQRQSPLQLPKKRVSNDLKSSSSLYMGSLF